MAIQYEDVVSVGAGSLAGRYLRTFWQPVFVGRLLESSLPQPLKILGSEFTIYRAETGDAHVVDPRCPHRGQTLAVGRVVETTRGVSMLKSEYLTFDLNEEGTR